jgi:hypothetical protein
MLFLLLVVYSTCYSYCEVPSISIMIMLFCKLVFHSLECSHLNLFQSLMPLIMNLLLGVTAGYRSSW